MNPEKTTLAWKILTKDRKSYKTNDDNYIINYPKKHVIKSIEGSLGIFCFDSFESAKEYIGSFSYQEATIRVLGIGEPIIPKWTGWEYKLTELYSSVNIKDFLNNYYYLSDEFKKNIEKSVYYPQIGTPRGLVCYKKIITLE